MCDAGHVISKMETIKLNTQIRRLQRRILKKLRRDRNCLRKIVGHKTLLIALVACAESELSQSLDDADPLVSTVQRMVALTLDGAA